MVTFGDIEPADLICAEQLEPDPDQVAIRLHEDRAALEQLVGQPLEPWHDLEPAEQSLALALGAALVRWLVDTDPDTAERSARHLHAVRRYWSPSLPPWDDLPDDARALGVALMQLLLDWLRSEGTL